MTTVALRTSFAISIALSTVIVVSACTSSPTGTATPSSSTASSAQPTFGGPQGSGGPGGGTMGPGGAGGAGGGMQTFTAEDLDTDGANASGANTAAVVTATNAFLATLDAATEAKVTYAFSDNQSRQTWSNYPAQQVPRKGVALADFSAESKAAALQVVKTMLSAQGYSQVQTIQQADDWLNKYSTSGTDSFGSDTDYYIAVYGTPSTTNPFMIQFGGHHLARNYTYKGTTASITPDFTGTEPKSFTISNTKVEPLKQKAGTLFAAIDSLTAAQKADAKISSNVTDILMGPGVDSGKFPTSEGVLVGSLSTAQKKLVLAAIAAWVDDAAPGEAASLLKTYESQLDTTRIASANSTTVNGENTYLRIDGPRVFIELINTRSRSTPNVHYHGVWRDKTDDYGSTNPGS